MRRFLAVGVVSVLGWCAVACGGGIVPPNIPREQNVHASPLGPSYVLVPLPTEDDSLLGRMLPAAPEPGRTLEETARPNPCADKLAAARTTPLSSTFEDAQDIQFGAKARAMLGVFGFEGDVQRATHFFYKLTTQKRVAQSDTTDYVACCKEKGCGYGYVSALIYGDGEYATAEEMSASAGVEISISTAQGNAALKVLSRRHVRGWLAAIVTVDAHTGQQLGPLGVAVTAGIHEATLPEQVKAIFEAGKIGVVPMEGGTFTFADGRGNKITEREFARRYRQATDSNELDGYDRPWETWKPWLVGGVGAVAAGAIVTGILMWKRPCTADDVGPYGPCDTVDASSPGAIPTKNDSWGTVYYSPKESTHNEVGGLLVGIGSMIAGIDAIGGITLLTANWEPEGKVSDHRLTEYDARLLADRYNRTLLRRTIRDAQQFSRPTARRVPRGPTLMPVFGLDSVGVRGTC